MKSSTRASVIAALVALVALVFNGALLINAYIEQERERDLLQWESRLGLVADAKAEAVARLLAAGRRDLEELATNASLRFYLWQLTGPRAGAAGDEEPGSLGYLRNLLLAAADRYGYTSGSGARVPANLPQPRTAGLAILGPDLAPVLATPGLQGVADTYRAVAERALAAPSSGGVEILLDAEGRAVMVQAIPIQPVPGATGAEPDGGTAGVLIGVRSAEDELYPLLTREPALAEASETLLLARRADGVAILSPTRDGSAPLRRVLPLSRTDLAETAALTTPGRLVALTNYRGERVLQVSRAVRGQDWILVQQVNASEALSLANERRRLLVLVLSLLLFSVAAVAVAAWRHGSGVRARHQAEELADKAARLQRQTDLLHTITDNLDALTLLVGGDGRVRFTNQAMASAADRAIRSIVDSAPGSFLPHALARDIEEGVAAARREHAIQHRVLRWVSAEASREFAASFIPMPRIGAEEGAMLVVLNDITDIQRAQQRHTSLLRRLVLTLVGVVDRHDPYGGSHAQRMSEVADALAKELGFNEQDRSTISLAASLANIGKIMIPAAVLGKAGPLTADEEALLHKHVEYGLELLRDLEFDGPVREMIAQKQERPDGRGYPLGLTSERLSLGGQIIAVANAFVALLSARAYRQGLTVAGALDELLRAAGTQYDRRVIAALFHVAENRRDWSQWH